MAPASHRNRLRLLLVFPSPQGGLKLWATLLTSADNCLHDRWRIPTWPTSHTVAGRAPTLRCATTDFVSTALVHRPSESGLDTAF